MTQFFFPNLDASEYVFLPGTVGAFLCKRDSSYGLLAYMPLVVCCV